MRFGACVFLACLFLTSCGHAPRIPAAGDLFGQHVRTTVDSEAARYYLENYLQGKDENRDLSSKIDALHREYGRSTPSREDLSALSRVFSVDFAALFLAHRLLTDECNRALNASFASYLQSEAGVDPAIVSSYVVLFVPGWEYVRNGPQTGADFAKPRALVSRFGLENHLVEIPPTGSVERNATVLASEIARRSRSGKKIILAGASSAGPAIHLVLGEMLSEKDRNSVKAWLNLGGILQGSPLVDHLEARPWLFSPIVWLKGWDKEAIRSMSTRRSRSRFARLDMGSGILVVNYLGVPLSGQLSRFSRDQYPILSSDGPNDGLTMLADAIAPNSLTIVALGSDHFFAEDPRIDEKTVALMKLMLAYVETSGSSRCPRPTLGFPRILGMSRPVSLLRRKVVPNTLY
jgi:hypothetical protein